jgi:hypothetical protein
MMPDTKEGNMGDFHDEDVMKADEVEDMPETRPITTIQELNELGRGWLRKFTEMTKPVSACAIRGMRNERELGKVEKSSSRTFTRTSDLSMNDFPSETSTSKKEPWDTVGISFGRRSANSVTCKNPFMDKTSTHARENSCPYNAKPETPNRMGLTAEHRVDYGRVDNKLKDEVKSQSDALVPEIEYGKRLDRLYRNIIRLKKHLLEPKNEQDNC